MCVSSPLRRCGVSGERGSGRALLSAHTSLCCCCSVSPPSHIPGSSFMSVCMCLKLTSHEESGNGPRCTSFVDLGSSVPAGFPVSPPLLTLQDIRKPEARRGREWAASLRTGVCPPHGGVCGVWSGANSEQDQAGSSLRAVTWPSQACLTAGRMTRVSLCERPHLEAVCAGPRGLAGPDHVSSDSS